MDVEEEEEEEEEEEVVVEEEEEEEGLAESFTVACATVARAEYLGETVTCASRSPIISSMFCDSQDVGGWSRWVLWAMVGNQSRPLAPLLPEFVLGSKTLPQQLHVGHKGIVTRDKDKWWRKAGVLAAAALRALLWGWCNRRSGFRVVFSYFLVLGAF